jgi:hypothetical protein
VHSAASDWHIRQLCGVDIPGTRNARAPEWKAIDFIAAVSGSAHAGQFADSRQGITILETCFDRNQLAVCLGLEDEFQLLFQIFILVVLHCVASFWEWV